jgi:hypothetical protein
MANEEPIANEEPKKRRARKKKVVDTGEPQIVTVGSIATENSNKSHTTSINKDDIRKASFGILRVWIDRYIGTNYTAEVQERNHYVFKSEDISTIVKMEVMFEQIRIDGFPRRSYWIEAPLP